MRKIVNEDIYMWKCAYMNASNVKKKAAASTADNNIVCNASKATIADDDIEHM